MKKSKDNTRVFVQNLPPSYKWGDLKDLFKANLPSELRTTVGEDHTRSLSVESIEEYEDTC